MHAEIDESTLDGQSRQAVSAVRRPLRPRQRGPEAWSNRGSAALADRVAGSVVGPTKVLPMLVDQPSQSRAGAFPCSLSSGCSTRKGKHADSSPTGRSFIKSGSLAESTVFCGLSIRFILHGLSFGVFGAFCPKGVGVHSRRVAGGPPPDRGSRPGLVFTVRALTYPGTRGLRA